MLLFGELENPLGEANALNNIGLAYRDQGQIKDALKSFQAALLLFEEIKNPLGKANVFMNKGLVYIDQSQYGDALKLFQAASLLFEELEYPLGKAQTLSNIGIAYAKQGKNRQAEDHLVQARTLYLQYGFDPQGLQNVEDILERLREDKREQVRQL